MIDQNYKNDLWETIRKDIDIYQKRKDFFDILEEAFIKFNFNRIKLDECLKVLQVDIALDVNKKKLKDFLEVCGLMSTTGLSGYGIGLSLKEILNTFRQIEESKIEINTEKGLLELKEFYIDAYGPGYSCAATINLPVGDNDEYDQGDDDNHFIHAVKSAWQSGFAELFLSNGKIDKGLNAILIS